MSIFGRPTDPLHVQRRSMMTTIAVRTLICLLGLSLASCGKPTPPILAGIGCAKQKACSLSSQVLTARLNKKYPIGSNQDTLDRDLIAQGFERIHKGIPHCTKRGDPGKIGVTQVGCPADDPNWNPQHALWYWNCGSTLFCNRYASIFWSSDSKGRITILEGYFVVTEGLAGL